MTVSIELGEVSDRPDPLPPAPPISRATRRAVAVVCCLLLLGGLLAGSVRLAPFPGLLIPAEVTDQYFRQNGRLVVVGPEPDGYSVEPRTIRAYGLPRGEPLWESTVDVGGPVNGVTGFGDLVLVIWQVPALGNLPEAYGLTALDAATGKERWQHTGGWPIDFGAGRVVFGGGDPDQRKPEVWEAVRADTGASIWRREFPIGSTVMPHHEGGSEVLVQKPGDGNGLQVIELATGRVLGEAAALPFAPSVTLGDDLAFAQGTGIDSTTVVAYRMPTLTEVWRRTYPEALQVQGCGDGLVCASSVTQTRSFRLDPASGAVLWENVQFTWYTQLGRRLLASGEIVPQEQAAAEMDNTLAVIDPADGRTLARFEGWMPIEWGAMGGSDAGPGSGRTIVAQFDSEERTALIGELDVMALAVRPLGKVRGVGEDCWGDEGLLTCRMLDGGIGVWELTGVSP